MELSDEVKKACEQATPIVALESTIISHGMSWPHNFDLALELEERVRQQKATPATIALINGQIKIGLSRPELEHLAKEGQKLPKLSRFDLPWAIAKGLSASCTVAATMFCAYKAKIKVFATGGIGGVHRDFLGAFDVSHDLKVLSDTPMIVVSAGAKAILDLPKTLEYLETQGVLTLGYQCDEFPAFYYRKSGLPLSYRVENPQEIADIYTASVKNGLPSAVLLLNPIPEKFELPKEVIEPMITQALALAEQKGIQGKALTPFLLQSLSELSQGQSLEANLHLVRNNVDLACQLVHFL